MAIAKLTLPTGYFVRPCFRLCLFMNIDVLTEKRYIMFNSFLSLNEDFWQLMMSVRISSCFIIKIIISRLVWKYYPHKKENGSFTSIFISWMFDDLRWNSVLMIISVLCSGLLLPNPSHYGQTVQLQRHTIQLTEQQRQMLQNMNPQARLCSFKSFLSSWYN